MNHKLSTLLLDAHSFNPDEKAVIAKKLDALLDKRIALYEKERGAADDAARGELFRSLLYTLSIDPNKPETLRPLRFEIPDIRLETGLQALEEKRSCARRLIAALRASLPFPPGAALNRTLRELLAALDAYDVRFLAHRIPCDPAYPLSVPVSPALLGIDYTLEYLLRLSTEMRLVRAFAPHRAMALLDGSVPDWRSAPVNLYLPLAASALGLTMLGKDARRLHISSADRETLFALLALKNKEQLELSLLSVFADTAKALGLEELDDDLTLMRAAKTLAPRVFDACRSGDLSPVFGGFALPGRR